MIVFGCKKSLELNGSNIMNYTKGAITEKSISECPRNCGECGFYSEDDLTGWCNANEMSTPTLSICNPQDRPLPLPLNCYWWYGASVWKKLPERKRKDYLEERIHSFTFRDLLDGKDGKERHEIVKHSSRPGGCGICDFKKYPEAKQYYDKYGEYPEFERLNNAKTND